MSISSLLLVTGAGASRELGEGKPLPLMDDWRKDLVYRLQQASLRDAVEALGLETIQKPEEFEERIGGFLAWQRSLPVARSLLALGKPMDGSMQVPAQVEAWFQQADNVAKQIVNVILDSLFWLFGRDRINQWNAGKAYEALLNALDLERSAPLAVATTNYDVAAEVGLLAAGRRPDWGEPQHFQDAQPRLAIRGLADGWTWYRDPVLHLHGRVGWYLQEDGGLMTVDPKVGYSQSLGQPGLLLPDPNKDYSELPALNDMWAEFDKLVQAASHILVLGHSLHDPRLIQHLQNAKNLAVTIYLPTTPTTLTDEVERVRGLVPSASIIPMAFGPEYRSQGDELQQWIAGP